MKKRLLRSTAILILLAVSALAIQGCKLKEEENKLYGLTVVMSSKNVDMTVYDFSQSYYSNQYYQYLMFGLIQPDQYCDMIIDDLSNFMYILNAAYDADVDLTSEEREELDKTIADQLEQLLAGYDEKVPAGTENVREEALKLFEQDLFQDGLDYPSFMELATKNLYMYHIANKYYNQLAEEIAVTDDEVFAYISQQYETQKENTVTDFADALSGFIYDGTAFPVYVPEDCFSVNHIYLAFETLPSDDDSVLYDAESRTEDEATIESRFPDVAGFDGFMELETEYGEDPGMDDEGYREYGYIIHPSMDEDYFAGFVYAAMNLHDGEWVPSEDADYELPELTFFELKDGTDVVKVKTESGVHYIIVNKEFKKGSVRYEKGDKVWESWKDAVNNNNLDEKFDALYNEWMLLYPIDVNMDEINKRFLQTDENTNQG